jgi:hypothetical protein
MRSRCPRGAVARSKPEPSIGGSARRPFRHSEVKVSAGRPLIEARSPTTASTALCRARSWNNASRMCRATTSTRSQRMPHNFRAANRRLSQRLRPVLRCKSRPQRLRRALRDVSSGHGSFYGSRRVSHPGSRLARVHYAIARDNHNHFERPFHEASPVLSCQARQRSSGRLDRRPDDLDEFIARVALLPSLGRGIGHKPRTSARTRHNAGFPQRSIRMKRAQIRRGNTA